MVALVSGSGERLSSRCVTEGLYDAGVTRPLLILVVFIWFSGFNGFNGFNGFLSAQSDLDDFMSRVLARRDENWKKLQQFILEERETLQVTGPGGVPLHGTRHEYRWFPQDGMFVRSPLRVDGVDVAESERAREEAEWRRREERRRGLEPRFVSSAYFLRFRFDPGQYALAGREQLDGHDVLRIEYYPTRMFHEGRLRPDRRVRERDARVQEKLNKSSLVTLWIDPTAHQILQYEMRNVDMEFLPGRFLARVDSMRATMRMGQAFEGVWLPKAIAIRIDGATAAGPVNAKYDIEYYDYRLAEVTAKIK
jgi:hypothetical protein